MTAYLLHDETGRAVSVGTVVADPLPAGLTSVPLTDAEYAGIQAGALVWDVVTRATVAALVPAAPTVDPTQLDALIDGATSLAKARDAMRAIVAAITP